jgi:hypothetical protein
MARSRPTDPLRGPVITVEQDHTVELQQAFAELASVEILVGIPSDRDQPHLDEGGKVAEQAEQRTASEEGGIQSNATLGYIHEHGSPINNIPPRPWLGPGVEQSKDKWTDYLWQAGNAALTFPFDSTKIDKGLNSAGQTAVSSVKYRITNSGELRALEPRTIAARRRRTPSRTATTQEDVTPLVDTAQMLNSITYVIKKGTTEEV